MTSAIDFVLTLILRLVAAVMAVIGVIEVALRRMLVDAGVTGQLQSAVLIVVAILLIIGAIRLLGGVFGLLVTALLIVNLLMPGLHIPTTAHV
jgi:secreted protein with Ig-like and vWFA domain